MDNPSIDDLSRKLCNRWGADVQRVVHELNELIAKALGADPPDLLGYAFVAEAVSKVMIHSCDLARRLQAVEQGRGDHIPGPHMMQ